MVNGAIYWDVLRLFYEIKQGRLLAEQECKFDSIEIDMWGVDFVLLDKDGSMLENPVKIIEENDERGEKNIGTIERFAFYEEAKKAYVAIATSKMALYANIMMQKI